MRRRTQSGSASGPKKCRPRGFPGREIR
jgi:hypothetical protein